MKKKYFIFILLFVLAVGYAAVNVTMYFEGSTTLGFNFEDADIYLGNLYSNNINKYNSISEDKTSFSLVLENGETNVDFYIVNNTKEYTENITITCNNIDTVTQEDNYEHMVYAQTTLKGSIKFTNTGAPKDLVCVVNNTEISSSTIATDKKTILFASNGFENITPYKIISGNTYGELPILSKENYTFDGWYNKDNVKIESTSLIGDFNDEILYAKMNPIYENFEGYSWNFEYNGTDGSDGHSQEFTTVCSGVYKIETWGAQGATQNLTNYYGTGGSGAYTSGYINLDNNANLYINVGGKGQSTSTSNDVEECVPGGFNGAGNACRRKFDWPLPTFYGSGGGATDIRLVDGTEKDFNSLKSRIMVSAGGGGFANDHHDYPNGTYADVSGGAGGGLNGYASTYVAVDNVNGGYGPNKYSGEGATQTKGGIYRALYTGEYNSNYNGKFGYAVLFTSFSSYAGGSGGYYGGASMAHSGSSFISGHDGCNAISSTSTSSNIVHTSQSVHYSGYRFYNTVMIDGEGYNWTTEKGELVNQTQPNGTNSTGHTGNGYARITYVSDGSYTITLDYNNSNNDSSSISAIYGDKINSLSNLENTKEAIFLGWYTEKENGVKITKNDIYTYTTDITLYAHWDYIIVDYDYTGDEQIFKATKTGYYKIETWGAQGGGTSINLYEEEAYGGYGGYSYGEINLTEGEQLYINVGGQGLTKQIASGTGEIVDGGYNGGGNAVASGSICGIRGAGGGATHIATTSGLLSELENKKSNIIIVSGGGGGAGMCTGNKGDLHSGLSGGGYKGGSGVGVATGGTQTEPGTNYTGGSASFGKGGDAIYEMVVADANRTWGGQGGGGGYYGGGNSFNNQGGSGGSGYIGNTNLTNKVMYCYNCEESNEESTKTINTTCISSTPTENCAKEGNGYVRITYLGTNKYTATNLIKNGSFEDGSTYWRSYDAVYLPEVSTTDKLTGNKSLYIATNEQDERAYNITYKIQLYKNHKYYIAEKVKVVSMNNEKISVLGIPYINETITFRIDNTIEKNEWKTISTIYDSKLEEYVSEFRVGHCYADAQQYEAYIDDVVFIDLTETFGAGNEPNKSWCDKNITWFEGTSSIYD